MGTRRIAAVIGWLLVGCRPSGGAEPPAPAPTASATTSPGASPTSAHAEGSARPVDDLATDSVTDSATDLPDTCELELELLEPTGARGKGKSGASGTEAKDAAWAQACAALQQSHGIDCHDEAKVAPVKEGSQSIQSRRGDGQHQNLYVFEVELGLRRRGKGFGDAPGDRQEACRRAKAHACQQLVQGPCPDTGLRVITVDGKPPSTASVEPRPTANEPRPTI